MHQLQNDIVLDHFHQPRNVATWDENNQTIATGRAGTIGVSDTVQLQLEVVNAKVKSACFRAFGDPYTIASASYTTEAILDQPINGLNKDFHQKLIGILAIPQLKWYCAILVEDALADALESLYE